MRGNIRLRRLYYRKNKDGSERVYYRRPGGQLVRLPALPENHPDFLRAYARAAEGQAPESPARAGTVTALAHHYLGSPSFLGLAQITRKNLRLVIDRIVQDRGRAMVREIEPRFLRKDISEYNPHPAKMRLKAWRSLCCHAVSLGWIEESPAHKVKLPATPKGGYPQWTLADLEQFRAHWSIGTRQRLAIELAQWTGARRSDLVALGPKNINADGWLEYTQSKTGAFVELPWRELPEQCAPLAADHAHLMAALLPGQTWLETAAGRQRSPEAVTEWIRTACRSAGLKKRSVHGLRKYRAAMLAEAGWSEHQIMAWTGHMNTAELQTYTRAVQRRKLIGG